jgi:hypothetical protein
MIFACQYCGGMEFALFAALSATVAWCWSKLKRSKVND